jgi:hypothetical protein
MNMSLFVSVNRLFCASVNGSCSCPPVGSDLGPSLARCIISGWLGLKLFRVVRAWTVFFSCFGPATRPALNLHL